MKVWNQRYMVKSAYFQPRLGGPIFIRIGGEEEIDEDDLDGAAIIHLAQKHKALVLSLEHRFYGESRPTPDIKTKNLRYLSSQQALADLEAFIGSIKKEYEDTNPDAKVVLFGCSYAGFLAAFHRQLYSNSTVGSVALFAPFYAIPDFRDYIDGVLTAVILADRSMECFNRTKQALNQVVCLSMNLSKAPGDEGACEGLIAYSSSKRNEMLHAALEFCNPNQFNMTNTFSRFSMFYDISAQLMKTAQYNRKRSDDSSELGTFCRYMTDIDKGPHAFQRYGAWRKEVDGRCIVNNGAFFNAPASNWNSNYAVAGTRQWLYQMCSEFGFFVSGVGDLLNMSYHMQTCKKSFNITDLFSNTAKTNRFYAYGSLNFTNIYFLHSYSDPWYGTNIRQPGKPEALIELPTIKVNIMHGISHCHEPVDGCSKEKELVDAWNDIDDHVSRWIGEPREGPGIFTECVH